MFKAGLFIGAVLFSWFGLVGTVVLNGVIGPSSNTIMNCKEIERAGYLSNECFEFGKYGPNDYWLKDRRCKRPPQKGDEK